MPSLHHCAHHCHRWFRANGKGIAVACSCLCAVPGTQLLWPGCAAARVTGRGRQSLLSSGARWPRIPLLVLATAASVIASQAVISGVFAITQQCQRLGYIPRVRILNSSAAAIGQVYVPTGNWLICVATILAIGFGSSSQSWRSAGRSRFDPCNDGLTLRKL
jgi:K+ transporter